MASSLIPRATGETVVGPQLGELLERQVLAPARSIGVDLPLAAVTDPPPPVEVRPSGNGTWWLASTFDADPVALSNGGVTKAPREVVEGLQALRAAGVDFDYIYLLHELPAEWTPGTPPPAMRIAWTTDDHGASVVKMQEAVFAAGLDGLRAAVKVAGIAIRGVATVGAVTGGAAVAGAIAYDPVILGGVEDPESDRIAWFALAAWDEVPR